MVDWAFPNGVLRNAERRKGLIDRRWRRQGNCGGYKLPSFEGKEEICKRQEQACIFYVIRNGG